jgi:hypothetical protein
MVLAQRPFADRLEVGATRGCIVRRARLHHRSSATGAELDYVILQTTELAGGRVARQVNVLDREDDLAR